MCTTISASLALTHRSKGCVVVARIQLSGDLVHMYLSHISSAVCGKNWLHASSSDQDTLAAGVLSVRRGCHQSRICACGYPRFCHSMRTMYSVTWNGGGSLRML